MRIQPWYVITVLALACCAPSVLAQSSDDSQSPPVCTDLTGKVRLPCPTTGDTTTTLNDDDSAPPPAAAPAPQAAQKHASQPEASREPTAAPAAATAAPNRAQPAVHPASALQPMGSEGDPRASIGLEPKTPPEPEPVQASVPNAPRSTSLVRSFVTNVARDQKDIWTSPLRLRLDDVQWLAPLLAAGTVITLSDTDIQRHLPTSANLQKRSDNYSTYGVAAFAGATGAAFLFGAATHNDHMRETGLLSGEAALDSFAVTYAIKSITKRDRPSEGNGHGTFFSHGDSFPSEHAAAAWSMATVIAHEYPGPLTTLLAYGGAAGVSAARVIGRQHFTSDAVVASAIGYFVGRHVYNAHHDQHDSKRYGSFERAPRPESNRTPDNMGSPFVPLDSWTYAAFDRLAALGYVQTAFAGLRPWTRLECVRLLDEAGSRVLSAEGPGGEQALRLYRSLQAEFALDSEAVAGGRNVSAQLESIYTRMTGISGKPLNDSYHFGQTIINDYGRPYQEGFNMVTGFTSHAEAGPLAFYVRGEYQHSPSAPAYPLGVSQAIANMDSNPVQPVTPFAAHDDFQLLDTYVALNIKNSQFSFGRQSLWWGPGQGGALMFSDNALPFYNLRWSTVSPFKLPSFLGFLGPMRTDFFIGRLEGHHFPSSPYVTGQKFSFKPTENLELGFSKISVFGGGGTPLTWHLWNRATFNYDDRNFATADLPGNDPGDRRSGFNFSYRIPGLRNWLTIYSDALADDDPSPLAAPRRAAWNPGIYLAHVPGVPKLDLRAESAYTDPPSPSLSSGGKFIYWNVNYHDSHTNAGNVMGSWVGRQGRGLQLWSTYWFSGQNLVRFGYRHGQVSQDFVAGGGTIDDFSTRAERYLHPDLFLSGWLQYEHWNFPLLSRETQVNVSAGIQLTYRPRWKIGK